MSDYREEQKEEQREHRREDQWEDQYVHIFRILCLSSGDMQIARILGTYEWTVGAMLKEYAYQCWSRLELPQVLDFERRVLLDMETSLDDCGAGHNSLLVLGEAEDFSGCASFLPDAKTVDSPEEMIEAISIMDQESELPQAVAVRLRPEELRKVWESASAAVSGERRMGGTKFINDLNWSIWSGAEARPYGLEYRINAALAKFESKAHSPEFAPLGVSEPDDLPGRWYYFHNAASLNLLPPITERDSIFMLSSQGLISIGPVQVHTRHDGHEDISEQSEGPTVFDV